MQAGRRRLKQARISFPLAVMLVLFVLMASEYSYQRSTSLGDDLAAAIDARVRVQRVVRLVLDAETGQRGYLITGEAAYLQPYREANVQIDSELAAMRQRYLNVAPVSKLFDQMERRIASKVAEMQTTVALRGAGDEGWRTIIEADIGYRHMEHIRELSGQLADYEWALIESYQRSLHRTLMIARTAIATIVVLGLLALALYLREANRNVRLLEKHQMRLQEERNMLEKQVLQRTRRLRRLTSHLQNVREDERARLARELHDELGALLVAAKLDLARLKSRLGATVDTFVAERIRHLGEALNTGIALKRRIIEDLHPSSLNKLGLVAAIEILTREFSERTGVAIRCDVQSVELTEKRKLTAFRLIQEALTNATKYANASQLQVRIFCDGDEVCIEVDDDGIGFDPQLTPPTSHGLEGMQYRVESQGGIFSIVSKPNEGTHIRARLPVGSDVSDAAV